MFVAVVRYGFERCLAALELEATAKRLRPGLPTRSWKRWGRTHADLPIDGDLSRLRARDPGALLSPWWRRRTCPG